MTPPAPPPALPKPEPERQAPTIVPMIVANNDNFPETTPGRITVRNVIEATAAHFKITAEALRSHVRTQPLVRRRQIAMYVAHEVTGRGTPFIGRIMGGRDHSTILHGVRAVAIRLDAGDVETAAAVQAIVAQVTGGAHV